MLLLCPMECLAVYKCIPPRSEPRNRLDEYSSLEMLLHNNVGVVSLASFVAKREQDVGGQKSTDEKTIRQTQDGERRERKR